MGDFDNLDEFTLAHFGDHHEQRLWSLLSAEFPAYEVFWRRYIVPLTCRVDPSFSLLEDRDSWIRFRSGICERQERLAMHHYSVFYFLGRAAERINSGQSEFPEDVFSLLDACADNALKFCNLAKEILQDFGLSLNLPTQDDQLCCFGERGKAREQRGGLVEIQKYRDTILHNPVLGRAIHTSRQFLPKREFLDEVRLSWSRAASLKPEQLVESKLLYARLIKEATGFLQETWDLLILKFDSIRETDKFRKQWSINIDFLPFAPAPALSMVGRPTADSSAGSNPHLSASGSFNPFQSPDSD